MYTKRISRVSRYITKIDFVQELSVSIWHICITKSQLESKIAGAKRDKHVYVDFRIFTSSYD